MDIASYSSDLIPVSASSWRTVAPGDVSYPADGNAVCFEFEDSSYWYAHRNRCILSAVKRLHAASPFFDLGGGNGIVSKALQEAGIETVLVEPGEAGIRNARVRGVRYTVQGTVEDCHFKENSLPSIGLFDVLEHINDDELFLRRIHSLMKPGGTFVLTVPAFPALYSAHDVQVGHFRRYTITGLKQLLRREGFSITFHTYLFSPLFLPMYLLKALPHRFGSKGTVDGSTKRRDHTAPSGFAGYIFRQWLENEFQIIDAGGRLSIGTSCLMVATKESD